MKMRMVFVWLLVLAVPAFGQEVRGFVWEGGRLRPVEPIEWAEPYEGEEESPVANENNVWDNSDSDGDYSNLNNWSLGHVPLITENVIFNRTAVGSVITGFAQGAVNLNSFTVHPGYTGDIGMSGSPLVISTVDDDTGVTGNVVHQGPGGFYLLAGANGIEFLYIDTDEQTTEIELDGVIDQLILIKGRIVALTSFDGASIWISYRNNPTSDVNFTLQSTAALADLILNGGTVLYDGTTTTSFLKMSGGRLIQGINGGSFSQLIQTGGYIEYNGTGTINIAAVLGGTLDLSQDGRPKTITLLSVFPGAKFIPNANTTITNNTQGSILPIVPIIP